MSAKVTRLFPDIAQVHGDAAALAEAMRVVEALLFAASEPLSEIALSRRLPTGVALDAVMAKLRADYAGRGVGPVRVGGSWVFRTAEDLGWLLSASARETTRLSRAAMETLAIIAYHQPATRADVESIRGVGVAKGTLDVLLATGWVRPKGRRRSPGRPVTYATTDAFLLHFGLEAIGDLPGLDELRGAGLFDGRMPADLRVPLPADTDPLDGDEEDPAFADPGAAEDEPLDPDG